jgi:uncharacterized protein with HEPN domain
MSRDWRLFYTDLIDFCRQILAYTQGMDRTAFEANRLVFDASLRNLELIGVDRDLVWHTVKHEIPIMLTVLQALQTKALT